MTPAIQGVDLSILDPERPLVVAVSGGADSVCLLHLLVEAGFSCHVIHINHQLRGAVSDADQLFVEELAAGLGCSVHVRTKQAVRAKDTSIEMSARRIRLDAYARITAQVDAQGVALAHHQRDQTETLLMRLIRGASPDGLGAMRPITNIRGCRLLRPMLGANPDALRRWLQERGQAWREDATNLSPDFTRNRIRHELLPLLRTINPKVEQHLATLSSLMQLDNDFLKEQLAHLEGSETEPHPALAWRLERLLTQASEPLPLLDAVELQIPSELRWGEWTVSASCTEGYKPMANPMQASCRRLSKLIVRPWRAGDRLRPIGLGGTRKLQDILTDFKIPAAQKARWPVFESEGALVWTPGTRVDESFALTNPDEPSLTLQVTALRPDESSVTAN